MSFKESLGFGEKFNPLILIQVIVVIMGFLLSLKILFFHGAISFTDIFSGFWSIYTMFINFHFSFSIFFLWL